MKRKIKSAIVLTLCMVMFLCCSLSAFASARSSDTTWNLHYALGANSSDNVPTVYRSLTLRSMENLAVNTLVVSHTFTVNGSGSPYVTITSESISTVTLNQSTTSASTTVSKNWSTANLTIKLNSHTSCNFVQSIGSATITAVLR